MELLSLVCLHPRALWDVLMESKNGLEKASTENDRKQSPLEEARAKRKVLCSVCDADFVNIVSEDSSVELSAISPCSNEFNDHCEQTVGKQTNLPLSAKRGRCPEDQKPASVHDAEVYGEHVQISRYFRRRGALCNPERMAIPQTTREDIEDDIKKRRRSVPRKLSNFLTTKLDLDRDEDLF